MGSMRRVIKRAAVVGATAYCLYAAVLFFAQRHVVFPAWHFEAPPNVDLDAVGSSRYWLSTSVGRVEAWYLPPHDTTSTDPSPVLIFTHGNGELIDYWIGDFEYVRALGIGVMLVEYPGYGRSEGRPSQTTITESVVAAYDSIAARADVNPVRIFAYGRSVGGGAACALVRERSVAALILQSTFTSARSIARRFWVPTFLVRDRFENLEVVRDYAGPVLLVHGRHDDIIPHEHGVALAAAAEDGLLLSYDCAHDDCPPDWPGFWNAMGAFLGARGLLGDPG